MRPLLVGFALLCATVFVFVHSPSIQVNAQSTAPAAKSPIDPQKEARIRELMDLTGAKDLGQQLIDAGMEEFRSSVMDSQPDNPRARQFVEAFAARFQKRFDSKSLNEQIIPIYDKYLSTEDLKGLLDYYRSPLGQRMLKALPDVARESQAAGYALGQKAAQDTMEELKADFPEFTGASDNEKRPGTEPNQN